ncbi:MAG TPA: hypothetical protein DCL66_14400, partial [Gammaproteobacteria bacterium]|nr:hypothetical protein [Gammaproteobacteria bacterium]
MGYTLNGLDMDRHSIRFSGNLFEQKRPYLEYIQSNIEQYLKQSVIRVLNPVWWLARKRVRNIVRLHTLKIIPPLVLELRDAVAHELDLFDIRQSLRDITKQLSFRDIDIKRALGNELICEISDLIQLLQTTQKYECEIRGAPNWEKFKLALTDHSGSELHEYVEAVNKSLERYDDIEDSLQLLKPMQEWLSDDAIEIITDQIITDENG